MIPLFDLKKSKKIPCITIALILTNIIFFFVKQDFSLFSHVNLWHLLSNMWFLWIFGDNVEAKIGPLKFLFLYFISGIVTLIFIKEMTSVPAVGASSAIAGVMGAYLILFPKNKLKVFPNFTCPSFVYIILWILLQALFFYFEGGFSFLGHMVGFISGILIVLFFK